MNKANRVLIGAVLILFIGFLVNYNGNMITGRFSKDVDNEITGHGFLEDFLNPPSVPEPEPTCTDDDNGVNYRVRSITVGKIYGGEQGAVEDVCIEGEGAEGQQVASCSSDTCYIKEYFCNAADVGGFNEGDVISVSEHCSNCVEGACIGEIGTPPSHYCKPTSCGGCTNEEMCSGTNNIPMGVCAGYDELECNGDINCEWYGDQIPEQPGPIDVVGGVIKDVTGNPVFGEDLDAVIILSRCRPKTNCIWTNGHCCADGERWNGAYCAKTSIGDNCFLFWPNKKELDKSVKYTEKQVCWDVGSIAYGFWVPVETY